MTMSKVNYWPTYTIVGLIIVVSAAFVYQYNNLPIEDTVSNIVKDNHNVALDNSTTTSADSSTSTPVKVEDSWRDVYPDTKTMTIASTSVNVSVADTLSELIKGLSGTPYLPDDVVKLFAFGGTGYHSIWMKEMNYSIDIIWVDKEKVIVHIERDVSPDTYPESFTTDIPALYVIETAAGFVEQNKIKLGDLITIPKKE